MFTSCGEGRYTLRNSGETEVLLTGFCRGRRRRIVCFLDSRHRTGSRRAVRDKLNLCNSGEPEVCLTMDQDIDMSIDKLWHSVMYCA